MFSYLTKLIRCLKQTEMTFSSGYVIVFIVVREFFDKKVIK